MAPNPVTSDVVPMSISFSATVAEPPSTNVALASSQRDPSPGNHVEFLKGLPCDVDRLLAMHSTILTKTKEKDTKGHTRIIIKCLVCEEYDDTARNETANNQAVPYGSGVRTEGVAGAKRLIVHLKGRPHAAALDAKSLHDNFVQQSYKHPWLNMLKKHRTHELIKLIRLAMDVYNDTLCETASGYSWPSRSLTSIRAEEIINILQQDWGSDLPEFKPTGMDIHYRSTDVYYEMLDCIAEEFKKNMISELSSCDGFGIQIDGSSDRQQLGIKFITARIVKDGECKTRFVAAVEPQLNGSKGLLEALDRGVRNPANLTNHSLQFKDFPDEDGYLESAAPPTDLRDPVFQKMLSLSTDGESANTGRHAGLWKLVETHLNRYVLCIWCVCHRSDLAFHDLVSAVPELKRWYGQVKQTVKFFHVSAKRTHSVRKHCKSFLTFVNPPDVRFAEHILAMCKAIISNMDGMITTWEEISVGIDNDRSTKNQAVGFMKMWDSSGQQFKLTCLMMDLLHILSMLQKEFQRTNLLLFDVPKIHDRFVQRIKIMETAAYPGGFEEKQVPQDSNLDNDDNSTRGRRTTNQFVTLSNREFSSIRQECILTLMNFLSDRMNAAQTEEIVHLSAIFMSNTAEEMVSRARIVLEKLKDDRVVELCDQSIDFFAEHSPVLCDIKDLLGRFEFVSKKVKSSSPLGLICNIITTAAPHSMVVERTVSHYNRFRSHHRMSMSLQAANNRLVIALNGCGTAGYDPRPAIAEFLTRKERRTRLPEFVDYQNRPFVQHFFRESGTF